MKAHIVAQCVKELGFKVSEEPFFDTVRIELGKISSSDFAKLCEKRRMNVRQLNANTVTISTDETTTQADLGTIEQNRHNQSLHFSWYEWNDYWLI
jgi:glycine dehydrogenase